MVFIAVVMMAAWVSAAVGVVTLVGSFGAVSASQVRCAVKELNKRPDSLRAERLRRIAVQERVNLGVALLLFLLLAVQLVTGGRSVRPTVFGAAFATAWVLQRGGIARLKAEARLRRLLDVDRSRIRREVEAMADSADVSPDAVVAPDGALRASLLAYVAAAAAWVAVAAAAWAPEGVQERTTAVATVAMRVLRIAPDTNAPKQPARPVDPPSPTESPDAPVDEPDRACTPEEAKRLFAAGVPEPTATAMYDAWFEYGVDNVGCPSRTDPPYRRGAMWLTPLTGGDDRAAFTIGSGGTAAVVLGDFASIISSRAAELRQVDRRLRWGAGSAQVTTFRNGTCRLLIARDYGPVDDLPPAVTALALAEAERLGAFPVLRETPEGAPRTEYRLAFLQVADRVFGSRVVKHVTITYDSSGDAKMGAGASASDEASCPVPRVRVEAAADAIEREALGRETR